jgi:diadenosine tetraphosphate (Ap4A) HIT family hydrolase
LPPMKAADPAAAGHLQTISKKEVENLNELPQNLVKQLPEGLRLTSDKE